MVVEVENGGSVVLTEHPGLDLSIPELSCALKAKLFQAMGGTLPVPLIRSVEEDLNIAGILLRRVKNYNNSVAYRFPIKILTAVTFHLEDEESLTITTRVCHLWRSVFLFSPRHIALLRRKNHRNSVTYRLPTEVLAVALASHLEDAKSLVIATRVCHLWRSVLLSSPCVWSHLTFDRNELQALMFLERSKLAPVSVDLIGDSAPSEIVVESLMRISYRLTSLRSLRTDQDLPFLKELLIKPLPILKNLDVATSGSLFSGSLAATSFDRPIFNIPQLTNVYFKSIGPGFVDAPRVGDGLLNFLRGCPMLEVASFNYGDQKHLNRDIEFTTDEKSTEAVSLPCLRSFTHESPVDLIYTGLFNRLSLPPTCDVAFTITDSASQSKWEDGFSTLRDSPYFFNVKKVRLALHDQNEGSLTVKATFLNSKNMRISLNRRRSSPYSAYSLSAVESFLDFLKKSEMAYSIESLRFEHYWVDMSETYSPQGLTIPLQGLRDLKTIVLSGRCAPAFFLLKPPEDGVWCPNVENLVIYLDSPEWNGLERVLNIAMSRREPATPLKTVTLFLKEESETLLQTRREQLEGLRRWVGSVEVIQSNGGRGDWTTVDTIQPRIESSGEFVEESRSRHLKF